MKKTARLIVALAGIASAIALGGQIAYAGEGKECEHWQHNGGQDCHCRSQHHHQFFRRQFEKMAAYLGLSEQQKLQIKEIFKKGMAEREPIMTRLITERRALRDLVQADRIDDAAIRAQAAKLAAAEGDMALERARMGKQIRAILTPVQAEKFKAFQAEREAKFDRFRERMHKRFENFSTGR